MFRFVFVRMKLATSGSWSLCTDQFELGVTRRAQPTLPPRGSGVAGAAARVPPAANAANARTTKQGKRRRNFMGLNERAKRAAGGTWENFAAKRAWWHGASIRGADMGETPMPPKPPQTFSKQFPQAT